MQATLVPRNHKFLAGAFNFWWRDQMRGKKSGFCGGLSRSAAF
jgi:hypothetical protein